MKLKLWKKIPFSPMASDSVQGKAAINKQLKIILLTGLFVLAHCQAKVVVDVESNTAADITKKINYSSSGQKNNRSHNVGASQTLVLNDRSYKNKINEENVLNDVIFEANTSSDKFSEKENRTEAKELFSYSNEDAENHIRKRINYLINEKIYQTAKMKHQYKGRNVYHYIYEAYHQALDNANIKNNRNKKSMENIHSNNINFATHAYSSKKRKRNTASMIDEELIFFDGSDQSYGIFEAKWPLCEIPAVFQKNFTFAFTLDIASANLNTATGLLMLIREVVGTRRWLSDKEINENWLDGDLGREGWSSKCAKKRMGSYKKREVEEKSSEGNDAEYYELKLVEGVLKLKYRKILKCDKRQKSDKKNRFHESNGKIASNSNKTRYNSDSNNKQSGKSIYRFKLFQGLILTSAGLLKNEEWERVELRVGGNEKGGWIEVVVAGRLQASKSFSCNDCGSEDDYEGEWSGEDADEKTGFYRKNVKKSKYKKENEDLKQNSKIKKMHACKSSRFKIYLGAHKAHRSNYGNNYSYENKNITSTYANNNRNNAYDDQLDKIKIQNISKSFGSFIGRDNERVHMKMNHDQDDIDELRLCSMEPSFRGFMRNIKAFLFHARHSVAKQASSNSAFVTGQGVQVGGEELGG